MNLFRSIAAVSIAGIVLFSGSAARGVGADEPVGLGLSQAGARAASAVVTVNGRRVRLTLSLFRNMMPSIGGDSSALQTTLTATTIDRRGLPSGLVIRSVRLMQGRESWSGPLLHQGVVDRPNWIMRGAWGGPLWEPGSRVNAIVECEWNRRTHRILLRGATVDAAY